MKRIYHIIVFLIISLLFFGYVGAQNTSPVCDKHYVDMVGNKQYLVNEQVNLIPSELLSGTVVVHILYKGDTIVTRVDGDEFVSTIQYPGNYSLQTTLSLGECKWVTDTPLVVYKDVVNIIGMIDKKIIEPYKSIFEQQSTLINIVSLSPEGVYKNLSQDMYKIKNSDMLIIASNAIDQVLEGLIQLGTASDFDLKNKNITIVNTMNRNLMKRIVSKYDNFFDSNKIYTTDKQNFISLIASLSNNEDITQSEYLSMFSLSAQKVPPHLFLSKIVDKLIYHGFPIDLIGLLLTISLAVLTITLFRQIIGFDIFGSYTPLMTGLSIYILGLPLSLVLFFFAFISTILVRLFTKKVYLLYSAKISLLISLYFLSIFIGLSFFPILFSDIISFSIFSNAFVIFPMLLIILVSEKLFYEGFRIISKGWWISVIEFIIVSYVVYLIIHSVSIQNFMLSYPEIIIVVIVLIVLAGRFSGLQLLEYFRFYPLLKKGDDEEE